MEQLASRHLQMVWWKLTYVPLTI